MLRLPESLLTHVGDTIAEGVAVAMAGLPGEYLEGAVQAAERKLGAGEKFTAADLKLAQIARQDDLHDSLDLLFGMVPLLEVVHDPLGELVAEVRRLAHTRQVSLEALIRALGFGGGERQTVVPAAAINHLFEGLSGEEDAADNVAPQHVDPLVIRMNECQPPQQAVVEELNLPEIADPDPLISSLFESLPEEEINLADPLAVQAERSAVLDDLFGCLPDLPDQKALKDAPVSTPVQATPRPVAGPIPAFNPRPGRVNLGLRS